jgi:uncharacterized protein YegJ (DUF2314 family)
MQLLPDRMSRRDRALHWGAVLAVFAMVAWVCWRHPGTVAHHGLRIAAFAVLVVNAFTPRLVLTDFLIAYIAVHWLQLAWALAVIAFNPWMVVGLLLVTGCLVYFGLQRRRLLRHTSPPADGDDTENGPLSIVALMSELPFVETAVLHRAAASAWGMDFTESDDEDDARDNFLVGEAPLWFVQRDGRRYLVHAHDRPYFDDSEAAAAQLADLRLSRAVADHGAWLAVDALIDDPENAEESRTAYAAIGKLLSELVDDDCLGLYFPQVGELYPYDSDMQSGLKSGDPLAAVRAFQPPPLLMVDDDDETVRAAVQEARRRWPEFVAAFEQRGSGERFAVKAPVSRGAQTEFIWLTVTAVEGDLIYGELANAPLALAGLSLGDRVTVAVEQLNDWLVVLGNGTTLGGVTVKAVEQAARRRLQGDQPSRE